ncbi:hypothetical protein GCM10027289_15720 [Tsukamurella serpentis]
MPESVAKPRSRRLVTALIALVSTAALALGTALTGAVAWAATTVLVVPGTATKNPSLVRGYQENAIGYYVAPTGACAAGGCTPTPVPYIAEFWPIPLKGWGGLQGAKWDDSVASGVTSLSDVYGAADKTSPLVIFGYSQGATVAGTVKKQISEQPGGVPENVSFVLIGNASRPNGGLFTRPSFLGHVPILDVTFGPGTPTNTGTATRPVNTTDVAFMYDGVTDFPRYPANLLATANALAGFWYVHGKYIAPKGDDPASATPIGYTPAEVQAAVQAATENCSAATYCQVSGDTRYVTLPAKILPIMFPLLDLGASTGTTAIVRPFIDLVSPVARVLIETGYDRTDYGRATPFGAYPAINPLTLGIDLLTATVKGVSEAASGTGDASKYLASKPSETSAAPSAPSTAPTSGGNDASLLRLARTATPTPGANSGSTSGSTADPSAEASSTPTASPAETSAASTPTATGTRTPSPGSPTQKPTSTGTTDATDATAEKTSGNSESGKTGKTGSVTVNSGTSAADSTGSTGSTDSAGTSDKALVTAPAA